MTKVYIHNPLRSENTFLLDRDHKKRLIKVMRLQVGDPVEVLSRGIRYQCRLSHILHHGVQLEILSEEPLPVPPLDLILGQAIPKGDRFEWLIQKATELGVTQIYPLITERTIVRPEKVDTKLQRWNEISEHAGGQSESMPAIIHAPQSLSEFLQKDFPGSRLFLHERQDGISLRAYLKETSEKCILFLVGPEGGWTPTETEEMEKAGFQKIHLGKRILRAETAGLALAAIIQYQCGDFSES